MPYTNNIRTHWGSVAESGSSQEQLGEWCGSVILSSACLRVAATHGWKATLDWTERNTAVVLVRFRLGLSPWCGGSEEQPSRATVIGLSLYVCDVCGEGVRKRRGRTEFAGGCKHNPDNGIVLLAEIHPHFLSHPQTPLAENSRRNLKPIAGRAKWKEILACRLVFQGPEVKNSTNSKMLGGSWPIRPCQSFASCTQANSSNTVCTQIDRNYPSKKKKKRDRNCLLRIGRLLLKKKPIGRSIIFD